ncbi:tetratricopeptide repeat protein [bacterium]|nr:tetratricopeptide repeat protein [bacterium]
MRQNKTPVLHFETLKIFQQNKGLALGLALLFVMGCSHLKTSDERVLRNSIWANNDRAPQSLHPKMNEEQLAQQEADAHFTMGESYSFQGEHLKAIEEFKQTLLKDPDSVTVRLRLAGEFVRAGLMTEAIEFAESSVQLKPENTEARMLLGGLYTSAKLYDSAVEQFQKVYELDSENEEAALFIGAVYAEKGEFEKADNHFYRVLKVPDFKSKAQAYFYLGKINHEKENSDESLTIQHLKKSIDLDPSSRETVLALSQILMGTDKGSEAEKVLLRFQDENGPDPDSSRLLAKIYLQNKDYKKASEHLAILSKFDGQNISLKIQRALIHMELKERDEAIVLLEDLLEEAPELDKARFYLGALYLDKEQYPKALENLGKIPPASTYFSDSRIQMTHLYKAEKNYSKAEKILEDSIKSRPDLPEFVAALATIYDSQKKYDKARDVLEKAIPSFPEDTQLKFFLGSVNDRLGKTQESIEAFKQVLAVDGDHVQALNYLAFTYAELGENLGEAMVMAKKALRLSPEDPFILDTVGWIYFRKGEFKEAQKYIEAAYRQKPDESIIVEHLGDVYVKTESWNRAATMYQQAKILETDANKSRKIDEKLAAIQNQAQPAGRLPASLPED